MPSYVLLSTLTPEGRKTVNERPRRISEVNKEIEQYGAKVITQYMVLGQYDFVTILDAPNNETVARVSAVLGSRGTVQIMSMPAISVEKFTEGFKSGTKK
ncbi:MAG: GYD domain-containing protein [Nitrososphaerales archaeon]